MQKLSDYTIITDVDGTLITVDGLIPQRNIDAIYRFTQSGGKFGIATGRSRSLMLEATAGLPINAPCVLYNGGVLYDKVSDKMLMELYLPEAAREYIKEINRMIRNMGVLVLGNDSYFQVKHELAFASFFENRGEENFKIMELDNVELPWYKVLFQIHEEQYEELFALVAAKKYPGVRFVGTNFTLVEMLPELSSKGYALEKLIEMGQVSREYLVAIGDFYNDQEMIEMAGIGVTLETAPEDLKSVADLVVGKCEDGAIADVIEHLESLCQ